MRIRIIIDTQDAADNPETPLTLNAYRDDDDGTPSRIPLDIDGGCLIGSRIPDMLNELRIAWERGAVISEYDDEPIPRTYEPEEANA